MDQQYLCALLEPIKRVFPEYDFRTLPPLPPGWDWSGDRGAAAPVFDIGLDESGRLVSVLVDYERDEARECAGGKRFLLFVEWACLFATDDWSKVLAVAELMDPIAGRQLEKG